MNRIQKLTLPAVILTDPAFPHNVGGAIRACSCFGLQSLLYTGDRISKAMEKEYLQRLPREERMKGYSEVEWINTERPLDYLPSYAVPVCVEVLENSESLTFFQHPDNAVYIFGPEDGEVNQMWRALCHRFVSLPTDHCANLSSAIFGLLLHRRMQRQLQGLEPSNPVCHKENRGCVATVAMDKMGWEGK